MLRPEAFGVGWKTLDDAQKRAVVQLARLLWVAVCGVPPVEDANPWGVPLYPWLGVDRKSNLAVLDGKRGTGKTTVLLSLVHACTGIEGCDDFWDCVRKADPSADPAIPNLSRRLIWLEPIDVERLPESANVLAAIIVRIIAAADQADIAGGKGRSQEFFGYNPDYQQAVLKMQQLNISAALGSSGNLGGRADKLDPDAFAVELTRAESSRLSINSDFAQDLNAIAQQIHLRRGAFENPLFVLPVDDFDLRPSHCLQLLRLIRLISNPRLFVLLLGDREVARNIVQLNVAHELSSFKVEASVLPLQPEEIRTTSEDIAHGVMRKLIPDAQCIELRLMSASEVLTYRPLDIEQAQRPEAGPQPLYELLADCPVEATAPIASGPEPLVRVDSLLDLLLPRYAQNPYLPDQGEDGLAKRAARNEVTAEAMRPLVTGSYYSVPKLFRSPPRKAADVWFKTRHLHQFLPIDPDAEDAEEKREIKREAIVEEIFELLQMAIQSEQEASSRERSQLSRIAERLPEGNWKLDISYLDYFSNPGAFVTSLVPTSYSLGDGDGELQQSISARGGEQWLFCLKREQAPRREKLEKRETDPNREKEPVEDSADKAGRIKGVRFFSEGLTWPIILFYDLLAFRSGTQDSFGEFPRPGVWHWASTHWKNTDGRETALPWPVPVVDSFWELDFFLKMWNHGVGTATKNFLSDPKNMLQYLAFVWLDAGTCVVSGRNAVGLPKDSPPSPADWKKLVERLDQLVSKAQDNGAFADRCGRWLAQTALLVMPEFTGRGLRPPRRPSQSYFSTGGNLVKFWRQDQQTRLIKRLRQKRLEAIFELVPAVWSDRLRTELTKDLPKEIADRLGPPSTRPRRKRAGRRRGQSK